MKRKQQMLENNQVTWQDIICNIVPGISFFILDRLCCFDIILRFDSVKWSVGDMIKRSVMRYTDDDGYKRQEYIHFDQKSNRYLWEERSEGYDLLPINRKSLTPGIDRV